MAPSETIQLSLVQPTVKWEDGIANRAHLNEVLDGSSATDLIVLPEMFATGFSMRPELHAEAMDGLSVQWMQEQAAKRNAVVTGSLIIRENGKSFNRLIWMRPDGTFEHYDKRHTFSFAGEDKHYSSGNDRIIVELKGWRVCPLICYDLRFPAWCRNQSLDGQHKDSVYDLLLFVANWPDARRRPWSTLLEARAHENQAYVVGVNRVGVDGNGIPHSGNSAAYSPKGEPLTAIAPFEESITNVTLSYSELDSFRSKFTAWRDKDQFKIEQ